MKRKWGVYLLILLIFIIVLIVGFCIDSKEILSEEQVFNTIQPTMKVDCDFLASYKLSSKYGNCPYCRDASVSSLLMDSEQQSYYIFEKVGKLYYVEAQVEINFGRPTYSGILSYNFTLDKNGNIVDEFVPDMAEYECYN